MLSNTIRLCFLRTFLQKDIIKNRMWTFKFQKKKRFKTVLEPKSFICFILCQMASVAKMEQGKPLSLEKDVESNDNVLILQSAITQADELFVVGKFNETYRVLSVFKDSDNVEILWRLSRALYNMSKQKGIDKNLKESYINEAFQYIQRALILNDKNYAVHKWMAILTDAESSLKGIKAKIKTLPIFKKHLMIAMELNPKDATSIYMLGQYMYNIADMSWMQIKIAETLFGTLPKASFEEAFQYFIKAEEIDPNFYSANLLMLGKTCLKLKRIEAAHYWLKCATSYPVRTDEDEAVKLEAEELLKTNPVTAKEKSNNQKIFKENH